MTTVIIALALVVVPILAGLVIGFTLSQLSGRRWGGVFAATLMLALPWAGTVLLSCWRPIIGLWDAIVEGFLVGLGVLFAGHRWFPGWREGALAMASVAASLVLC